MEHELPCTASLPNLSKSLAHPLTKELSVELTGHCSWLCYRNQCPFFPQHCGRNKSNNYLCEAAILPWHGEWPRCPRESKLPRSTPKVPSQSELRKGGAKNTVILPAWFLTRIPKFHLLKINWRQNCNRNLDANQYGNSPSNFLTITLNFFYQHWLWFFILKGKTSKIYMRENLFIYFNQLFDDEIKDYYCALVLLLFSRERLNNINHNKVNNAILSSMRSRWQLHTLNSSSTSSLRNKSNTADCTAPREMLGAPLWSHVCWSQLIWLLIGMPRPQDLSLWTKVSQPLANISPTLPSTSHLFLYCN